MDKLEKYEGDAFAAPAVPQFTIEPKRLTSIANCCSSRVSLKRTWLRFPQAETAHMSRIMWLFPMTWMECAAFIGRARNAAMLGRTGSIWSPCAVSVRGTSTGTWWTTMWRRCTRRTDAAIALPCHSPTLVCGATNAIHTSRTHGCNHFSNSWL